MDIRNASESFDMAPALPEGVRLIDTRRFDDDRGWFMEGWNRAALAEQGLEAEFVQDNLSWSHRGVLRGLHLQVRRPQGKLVRCLQGAVFDVVVDLRPGSAQGRWAGLELSAAAGQALWIPPGFAHGFLALSEGALVSYKCTAAYAPDCERTLMWNDPALGVDWPLDGAAPVLSAKDQAGLSLGALLAEI